MFWWLRVRRKRLLPEMHRTVPIVMAGVDNPVAQKLVVSLPRPVGM
jgi:ABC-type uncharacterized transport system substrate-binding protein